MKGFYVRYTDEYGNVHKIKKQSYSKKELKKIERQKELARKRGDVPRNCESLKYFDVF